MKASGSIFVNKRMTIVLMIMTIALVYRNFRGTDNGYVSAERLRQIKTFESSCETVHEGLEN